MTMPVERVAVCFVLSMLSACGTYVPNYQDAPDQLESAMIRAIVRGINCEIRDTVVYVIHQDLESKHLNGVRSYPWFDTWGFQAALTLSVSERSIANPTALLTPLTASNFTLGVGLSGSAEATRVGTLNWTSTVKEYNSRGQCRDNDWKDNSKSPLVQSDLKLRPWLLGNLLASATGETKVAKTSEAAKSNGSTYQVKFQIDTSGGINPAWKLVEATVNGGGVLFTTSRSRVHDLTITFGPVDPNTNQLSSVAAGNFLASQIGVAIANQRLSRF